MVNWVHIDFDEIITPRAKRFMSGNTITVCGGQEIVDALNIIREAIELKVHRCEKDEMDMYLAEKAREIYKAVESGNPVVVKDILYKVAEGK